MNSEEVFETVFECLSQNEDMDVSYHTHDRAIRLGSDNNPFYAVEFRVNNEQHHFYRVLYSINNETFSLLEIVQNENEIVYHVENERSVNRIFTFFNNYMNEQFNTIRNELINNSNLINYMNDNNIPILPVPRVLTFDD
jgi:hypothetical protein